MEVGVRVATRTTPPPKLNENQQAAFIEEVKATGPSTVPNCCERRKVEAFFASRGTDERAGRRLPPGRQPSRNRIAEGFGGGLLLAVE